MNALRRWLLRGLFLLFVIVVGYQLWIFLHICWWIDHNPGSSAFMRDRLAVMQKEDPNAKLRQQWVDYRHISVSLKRAVIASEDAKFLEHQGFDWEGIQKAYEKNLKKGRIVAGGSTISQQLAKNLFLSTQRTPWRKLEEAFITLLLEKMMSKRRILEIYLNVIEWGNGVFGAQAAARHYYGISASQLSPYQSARLAAMVPNPRYYDKRRNSPYLAKRTGTIQARMYYTPVP
ncbi:monofunctional biosynthetic peptidoglycan transglycosylase [Methylobacillus flagellatus]|uniref:monofunctional biosynthetic peptidoglycan transglycosylase n=1 Tax=Methylobacillus flagellatus TaxID=405 RepID=UPI0010F7BB06|nr:monofunctional biosynthetic peptidoglycan transglycosylase [Methylobacillus flagellatus]